MLAEIKIDDRRAMRADRLHKLIRRDGAARGRIRRHASDPDEHQPAENTCEDSL